MEKCKKLNQQLKLVILKMWFGSTWKCCWDTGVHIENNDCASNDMLLATSGIVDISTSSILEALFQY